MPGLSDEELVLQYRNGSAEAEEMLLKRYTVVVKREVRYLYLVGAETEDLMQEAMIGLVKAIRDTLFIPSSFSALSACEPE